MTEEREHRLIRTSPRANDWNRSPDEMGKSSFGVTSPRFRVNDGVIKGTLVP